MPFAGLGLHVLIALLCAVHAVRNGQPLYWLFILFAFPLLGSLVYLFVVVLPHSKLQRGALKAVSVASRAMDPAKDVRAARAEFELTPTAQNQMRLAVALLDGGAPAEAADLYEGALKGPFANDPDLRLGAARAYVDCQRFADALPHIQELRSTRPDYSPDAIALLMAKCHAGVGRAPEARAEFEGVVSRFGTFEAHAEYAIWALGAGDTPLVTRLLADIEGITRRWNPMARELNEPVMRRLKAAQELAKQRG